MMRILKIESNFANGRRGGNAFLQTFQYLSTRSRLRTQYFLCHFFQPLKVGKQVNRNEYD